MRSGITTYLKLSQYAPTPYTRQKQENAKGGGGLDIRCQVARHGGEGGRPPNRRPARLRYVSLPEDLQKAVNGTGNG